MRSAQMARCRISSHGPTRRDPREASRPVPRRRWRRAPASGPLVGATGIAVPIGFGEHHVERDGRCAHVPQTSDQVANEVAPPGPLADRRQASFIHVDDDDAATGRSRAGGSKQDVVRRVVQASEKRGWKHREHAGDDHRTDAAQKHETPTRRPGLRDSRQA